MLNKIKNYIYTKQLIKKSVIFLIVQFILTIFIFGRLYVENFKEITPVFIFWSGGISFFILLNIIFFFKTIIDIFCCFGNSQAPSFKSLLIGIASSASILLLFFFADTLLNNLHLDWHPSEDTVFMVISTVVAFYLTIHFFLICRSIVFFILLLNKTVKYLILRLAKDKNIY
ncbi:hypothetical protein BGI37_03700 [Snodgrassella alvi]|jgi:hypothetical protein|nr:hypothetical protein BGI37_06820 [Snodgrassella alvi]PIT25869.1 hypothetical protein BGI37_06555 [Snodgrassella alvi]PIT27167.1 hypothetical protein BGI37_03700 [Snodgrassella alvi]